MDAFLADTDIHYSEIATVLLAATSDAAMARADKIIRASGLPVGAKLQIEAARERLGQQASATALWLELDRDVGFKPGDVGLLHRAAQIDGDLAIGLLEIDQPRQDPEIAGTFRHRDAHGA